MEELCSIGVDVGGTFTDFVLFAPDIGQTWFHKRLTVPQDPAAGVIAGIRELLAKANRAPAEVGVVVAGSTLGSNAVLERKGAATTLITTAGFSDLLDMGSEQRYDIHDLFLDFPAPLVARPDRHTVEERIAADGSVVTPLERAAVADLAARLDGAASVAVCFINSYANGEHEALVGEILRSTRPDLPISLSHEVSPEIREVPRFSTTVINAYIAPVVSSYLRDLQDRVAAEGIPGRVLSMLSSGATLGVDAAAKFPVRTLESGPAGGVMSVGHVARRRGDAKVLAFDMGGTTAKAALVMDATPLVVARFEVARTARFKPGSGFPVQSPTLDLLEVSGGGGSIAHIDTLGLLRVGPDSAGADPGPACYQRGGTKPTVTDALACLGYLPDALLGGSLRLDRDLAENAVRTAIAEPLGVGIEEAAWGIFSVVVESMASALRIHCIEHGVDPRDITLYAIGGAGPAVATSVAGALRCSRVVVPVGAGVTSAHGFLRSPRAYETSRSMPSPIDSIDWPKVAELFESMADEARQTLELGATETATTTRRVDISLVGQAHELTVSLPEGEVGVPMVATLSAEYRDAYRTRYGADPPDRPLQVLTWRLSTSAGSAAEDHAVPTRARNGGADNTTVRHRRIWVGRGWEEARIFDRSQFRAGATEKGPMIIEDAESTIMVPPAWSALVDHSGDVVLEATSQGGQS